MDVWHAGSCSGSPEGAEPLPRPLLTPGRAGRPPEPLTGLLGARARLWEMALPHLKV